MIKRKLCCGPLNMYHRMKGNPDYQRMFQRLVEGSYPEFRDIAWEIIQEGNDFYIVEIEE